MRRSRVPQRYAAMPPSVYHHVRASKSQWLPSQIIRPVPSIWEVKTSSVPVGSRAMKKKVGWTPTFLRIAYESCLWLFFSAALSGGGGAVEENLFIFSFHFSIPLPCDRIWAPSRSVRSTEVTNNLQLHAALHCGRLWVSCVRQLVSS